MKFIRPSTEPAINSGEFAAKTNWKETIGPGLPKGGEPAAALGIVA